MSSTSTPTTIVTIGIDLGKHTFHLVGLGRRGAIVLQAATREVDLPHRLERAYFGLVLLRH